MFVNVITRISRRFVRFSRASRGSKRRTCMGVETELFGARDRVG